MKVDLTQTDLIVLSMAYSDLAKKCRSNAEYLKDSEALPPEYFLRLAAQHETRAAEIDEMLHNSTSSNAK